MSHYFPYTLAAGTLPTLPTTLTMEEVISLTMVDTHREWRVEPKHSRSMSSSAPLLTIKTTPSLSLFLTTELNPMVSVRARIRAGRIHTQFYRYARLGEMIDPSCTFHACRTSAPHSLDTIDHILLACPRHQITRQLLSHRLNTLCGTSPLSVALISGELPPMTGSKKQQQQHGSAQLTLTAAFLAQVMKDREHDVTLQPFYHIVSDVLAPQ
jgi:hypothetical protein